MRKKSGFTFVEQAIVLVPEFEMVVHKLEQQVTLRGHGTPWVVHCQPSMASINPCHCPVCKTGQMIRIRKLSPIRSPPGATSIQTHPQL